MVIVVLTELASRVAVTVALPALDCDRAEAANVTEVCRARRVALFGVFRYCEESEIRIVMSLGAAAFNVTTHWVDCPDEILCGRQLNEDNARGVTVRTVRTVDEPRVAVIVAFTVEEIEEEVAWKLAAVAPAAIVTEDGTRTAELLEVSDTDVPPDGAAAVNVAMH